MLLGNSMMMRKLGGGPNIANLFQTSLFSGNDSDPFLTNLNFNYAANKGLVWTKRRDATGDHFLFDTLRGNHNILRTNTTGAASSYSDSGYFLTNGFNMSSSDSPARIFGSSNVAWGFLAAPRFFDVVTYTGNGTAGRTINHNLGVAPGLIIAKRTDSDTNWAVNHRSLGGGTGNGYLLLHSTNASSIYGGAFWGTGGTNYVAPTSTEFTISDDGGVNASGGTYVAYLFAHDTAADGVVQCGSYTGNGSSTGPTITLGWRPQWAMIKRSDSTGDWWIYDNARSTSNPRINKLLANSSAAEDTSGEDVDFLADGIQPKTTAAGINANGGTYLYTLIRAAA